MSEVQALSVVEADYKWPDDELVVRKSDYDALAAECERLQREAKNDAIAYRAAIERQNEIRAERDAALAELAKVTAQRDAILQQARAWSCEAKTQRATVLEVGEILGGVPDWGPIASGVEAMRAELAALKGGREAVAWAVCREPGKVDALSAAYASESAAKAHVNSYASKGYSGLHVTPLYTAPPAQASAWVAEGWSIERTPDGAFCLSSDDGEHRSFFASWGHKPARAVSAFLDAMLAATPTPGASDGKGGE